mmetsp:Transcript_99126/g.241012  ORF Transcript_99126/g.241012 Transcript_99126/m.241012 type:complete len:262 (-) Transcript_99126:17-802(-)
MWRSKSPGLLISTLAAFAGGPALRRSGTPGAERFWGAAGAGIFGFAKGLEDGLSMMSVGRKSGGLKGMDFTAVGRWRGFTAAFAVGVSFFPGGDDGFSSSSSHLSATTVESSASSSGLSSGSRLSTLSHCTSNSFRHSSSSGLGALLAWAFPKRASPLPLAGLASAGESLVAPSDLSAARATVNPVCATGAGTVGESPLSGFASFTGFSASAALASSLFPPPSNFCHSSSSPDASSSSIPMASGWGGDASGAPTLVTSFRA